ncbi:hypothetical protein KIF24_01770 [Micromonospora sp. Llam7]|uniref:hypothetical protein n=1 Tax=Micromonospora tarapacensis TaxID=2835305 RepID=UPI001C836C18|nr:hypothetical protein [Micromonospora tarapacensis]MBX7264902.1 hypothetical protein [Micromonospora tarapacensis]
MNWRWWTKRRRAASQIDRTGPATAYMHRCGALSCEGDCQPAWAGPTELHPMPLLGTPAERYRGGGGRSQA